MAVEGGPGAGSRPGHAAPAAAWLRVLQSRELGVVAVLVLLCVLMAFTSARSSFFSSGNIHNILLQMSLLSIFAIGETLVIVTGGIDLSLGSMIAFSGMVLALAVTRLDAVLVSSVAIGLAVLVTLAAALAVGGLHATLIHRLRLPPFVVTLASLLILRSQSLLINRQLPISLADYPGIMYLGNGNLFDGTSLAIPIPLLILAVLAVTVSLLMNRCRIGRYVYSIGSNETATRLSGVNVYRVKLFAYGVSAVLGGLAGILWAGYGGQGDPQAGNSYELDAVAAAVVGGASLMGGQGSVSGTILGGLLLHSIFSAINLTLTSPDLWRGTVVGGVLLFAVLVTALQQKQQAA